MAKIKIEATGVKHSKRVLCDGRFVALAEEFSNGKWGAFAVDGGQQLTLRTFENAKDVGKWVKEHLPS
jgi:hypothetical protein